VPDSRLYSIAAIAKILDVPESTLHYWKNRFEDMLPSYGAGRGKRFRAEAVEVFRDIGAMLSQGMAAGDVRAALARRYPVNVGGLAETVPVVQVGSPAGGGGDAQAMLAMATAIGSEIARTLAEQLGRAGLGAQTALPGAALEALAADLEQTRAANAALSEKVGVLEAELMRIRKDRRELESYLVDKINALRRPGGGG
jgi:DNA-binding transcriptional MerR regulator